MPSTKPEPLPKTPAVEKDFAAEQIAKEKLVDKAPILSAKQVEVKKEEELTPKDIKENNQIIENLPAAETKQVKAEIEELKKELTEYKEDVKEVEQLTQTTDKAAIKLSETKSAKILSKRVQKLIGDMDKLMSKIENEKTVQQPSDVK